MSAIGAKRTLGGPGTNDRFLPKADIPGRHLSGGIGAQDAGVEAILVRKLAALPVELAPQSDVFDVRHA